MMSSYALDEVIAFWKIVGFDVIRKLVVADHLFELSRRDELVD